MSSSSVSLSMSTTSSSISEFFEVRSVKRQLDSSGIHTFRSRGVALADDYLRFLIDFCSPKAVAKQAVDIVSLIVLVALAVRFEIRFLLVNL
jgi:hypothetical protein